MVITKQEKEDLASSLYEAFETNTPIDRLTAEYDLSIDDAYDIQSRLIDRHLKDGASVVGHKIGLTSEGIQNQLNVSEPDYGRLLDRMCIKNDTIHIDNFIQPRVEPEIGFIMGQDLSPPVTVVDVLAATQSVVPVLEVIDSRVREWDINIQDTVADNASSATYVTGDATAPVTGTDLSLEGVKLYQNGELVDSGVGAAVLDHPARAVTWLTNKLDEYDQQIQAGQLILSGSITPAADLDSSGTVTAEFTSLGTITVSTTVN